MVLHTVNRSPLGSSVLNDCIKRITPPAALLLLEDGVYAADQHLADRLKALPEDIELYALGADLDARGLGERLNPAIQRLTDQEFVELSLRCERMQAWY